MRSTPYTALVASLEAQVSFPGRVRVFADLDLASALASVAGSRQLEWVGSTAEEVLATACGAAVAEAARAGWVVAVIRGQAPEAAWSLATDIGSQRLLVLEVVDQALARLRPPVPGPANAGLPTQVQLPPALASTLASTASPAPRLSRREWSPLQLGSLARSGRISWPVSAGSSAQQLACGLRFLRAREPALLLPHEDPAWLARADGPAKLMALAQLCAEGRRVAWLVPAGVLACCRESCGLISARNLGIKLLVDAQELPNLLFPGPLERWWVAATSEPAEAEAVLTQQLAHEDPCLLGLASGAAGTPAWAREESWYPASGRLLQEGSQAVVVCSASGRADATDALQLLAQQGLAAALWQCTSLCPLPWSQLRALAASGRPLVIFDAGAPAGFAAALSAVLGVAIAHASGAPGLVEAVRQACRARRSGDPAP